MSNLNIKQLAAEISNDEFVELCARVFINQAVDATDSSDFDEILETAGWIATQGQYESSDVYNKIKQIIQE